MRKARFNIWHMILGVILGALAAVLTVCLILGPQAVTVLEAMGMARTAFIGEYDPDKALDGAMNGLVQGLGDRWSYYLNAKDYAAQNENRSNSYVGVGITVTYGDERGLLIEEVVAGGPADQAGVLVGELILAVDGESISGEARYDATGLIKGEAGTQVKLTLLSPGGTQREVTVTRKALDVEPVSYEMLPGDVGYVRLKNFYDHSADKLSAGVDELVSQGARALVFDMRNNGGGYVSELTDMLDHLLPEGPIFRTRSKLGIEQVVDSDKACVELPMVVLVNKDTYSAAEFFAAELQEAVGAGIVGEPTSGKGYSQQALPLHNGGALNLSTAQYYTGKGVSLIGTGVTLDAQVSLDDESAELLRAGHLEWEDDLQLRKALELLEQE